jgi:hypothetical protein
MKLQNQHTAWTQKSFASYHEAEHGITDTYVPKTYLSIVMILSNTKCLIPRSKNVNVNNDECCLVLGSF